MTRVQRRARAIPPLLKDLNERTVLETIREGGPISRAEISRRAHISKPTVSLALQSLLDAGLVREVAHDPGRPSYGAVFFEPVSEAALVLGLDLGARFLRGAICDLRGDVRARQDVELNGADAETVILTIADLRTSLVEAAGLATDLIDGVVMGVPGVVDDESGKLFQTHFTSLEGRPLRSELAERLALPVMLENDVNLAAVGEHWQGVARGVDDFVLLWVGTGLGAGLMLRGELHRGRHGAAGEIDAIAEAHEGDIDPCPTGIIPLTERLVGDSSGATTLVAPYDVRAIFAAARAGDGVARAVADEVARRIAIYAVSTVAVTDVALVVLGGGVGANGDLLLDPVRRLLAQWLPYPPRVEVSSLGEAGVLTGALAVGLRSALDNVFVNRTKAVRA